MKTIIKVTLISLLWLAVINPGTILGLDTSLRLQMAHAWWTGAEEVVISPDAQPKRRGDIRFGVIGRDGKRRIAYDVGQSLLMLPGDWLGSQLSRWFPKLEPETLRKLAVQLLIFVPLNGAAVVSCFWLLKLFKFEERIAGLTSIAWLLSTTFLHYAQFPQQNNQILLFATIGYAAALACVRYNNPRFALLSGLAVGSAILIRTTSIIHALTVLFFLVGCMAYRRRPKLTILKVIALWIIGSLPFTLLGRIADYIRYGGFWDTGNGVIINQLNTDPMWLGLPQLPPGYPFINEPWVGIIDALFSLPRSIFIYDPLLLPCIGLGIILWKRISPDVRCYLVNGILNLSLHIVLTSKLIWNGGTAWGSRFHVTSVHLLLIPLIALFIQRLLSSKGLKASLMKGILTIAMMTQIASIMIQPNLEIYQKSVGIPGSRLEFRLGQRVVNIACFINNSISRGCVDRNPEQKPYLDHLNTAIFLPFTLNQEASGNPVWESFVVNIFIIWAFLLVLAIGSVIGFIYLG